MFLSGIGYKNINHRSYYKRIIVDETVLKVSNQFVWVWIAIDSNYRTCISVETTIL
jgi:transposase-like protein